MREAPPAAIDLQASASAPAQSRVASATNNGHHVDTTAQPARTPGTHTQPSPAYRTIVADPGLSLQLPCGPCQKRTHAIPATPRTLHDDDRLGYAQIYEARQDTASSAACRLALGDAACAAQLHPLKPRRRCSACRNSSSPRANHSRCGPPAETSMLANVSIASVQCVIRRASASSMSPWPSVAATKQAATTCRQIPQQYLHPRHHLLRAKKCCTTCSVLGTLPPQAHALTRWLGIYPLRLLKVSPLYLHAPGSSRNGVMLGGKSQSTNCGRLHLRGLLRIIPLSGVGLKRLAAAGYDPAHMLAEWEVFWRRKGL